MALLHMDGFDGYANSSQMQMRYASANGPVYSATGGRFGGVSFSNGYVGKAITGSPSTVITGAAINLSSSSNATLFDFRNANGSQCSLFYSSSNGTITMTRNVATVATFAPPGIGVYRFWEVKLTCHASAGSIEVRVDGVALLNLTGINTMGQSAADITRVDLNAPSGGAADDWYILDTTGSAPLNDFLGDIRITTLRPTADSSVAWTRSTGSVNAAAIDDTTVDAVDYVSSSTVGQRDVYNLGDLTGTPTVYAMMATAWGLKTDAGTRGVKVGLRYSGTEIQSADLPMTTTTSPYTLTGQAQAPGAVAWTPTIVNATQLTLELGS